MKYYSLLWLSLAVLVLGSTAAYANEPLVRGDGSSQPATPTSVADGQSNLYFMPPATQTASAGLPAEFSAPAASGEFVGGPGSLQPEVGNSYSSTSSTDPAGSAYLLHASDIGSAEFSSAQAGVVSTGLSQAAASPSGSAASSIALDFSLPAASQVTQSIPVQVAPVQAPEPVRSPVVQSSSAPVHDLNPTNLNPTNLNPTNLKPIDRQPEEPPLSPPSPSGPVNLPKAADGPTSKSANVAFDDSLDSLFAGGADSLVAIAVGSAEGTRTPQGDRNPGYFGHTDPGNGVWNLGSFSYQHGAASPKEADEKQLSRLRKQAGVMQEKAAAQGITLSLEEQLNGIDLANQAPKAVLDRDGYVDWLSKAHQKGLDKSDAVLWARVQSFIDPNTQKWNAPGLGNSPDKITHDQERRMLAIANAISAQKELAANPSRKSTQQANYQPQGEHGIARLFAQAVKGLFESDHQPAPSPTPSAPESPAVQQLFGLDLSGQ
jgi:hypothetical protein